MLRPWLELARISNLPTVWTNVLAGWLLGFGGPEWQPLAWLLVGGSLMYTAGMILNDAADVRWDRENRKARPIPSGKVSLAAAWSAGLSMLLGGAAMAVWGAGACIWLTGALVAAIVAYDLFHKPWSGSVLLMGSCRTLLYLVAGSAVTGGLDWTEHRELCVKAMALGAYIVGVSLAARYESKVHQSLTGKAPKSQQVAGGLSLLAPAVAALWYAGVHQAWLVVVFAVASLVTVHTALNWMRENPKWIGRAVSLLLASICLVDAAAVASVSFIASILCLVAMQGAVLAQRKIAAT
ncbi:4-hydroxybenzoate polyprenyltransferase [Roseimicrobium gellanilyticum]|uniref:4-hydroxybenzoate polyprenyltransferase n=1 Tax=Roseimicrobium gellanilyticum TaxID=748857 RepID=A0A366HG76_9BACT|nr:UbiA family prenyltransferase [Roseimicrobium gellanilyticum]RBP41211.1 4-hydroxybenzoate polyprenyltransferase [Roseimicrobium gellanilyticum]